MKKWFRRLIPAFIMCVVICATVLIGIIYFNFISRNIFEDSTNQLKEMYGLVNRSFGEFIQKNWGILNNYDAYFENLSEDEIKAFISKEKEYWKYTNLYFIASQNSASTDQDIIRNMSYDGKTNLIEIEVNVGSEKLFTRGKKDRQNIVLFTTPVAKKTYNGFEYDTIGISYTNQDVAQSLNSSLFSNENGSEKCFIVTSNGTKLLSTSANDPISNILQYLHSYFNLPQSELDEIEQDLNKREYEPVLKKLRSDGVDYILLYEPIDYGDLSLMSLVPERLLNAGFMSVQKTTINVLLAIFFIIGFTVLALLIFRSYNISRKSKTELAHREKMFDVLSSTVDDIFIMIDPQTQLTDYISPNVERLLGIPLSEAQGTIKSLAKCAVNYDIVIPEVELAKIPLNGTKSWECEYMHQKTGERRWYRVTIYPMLIQNIKKYIIVMSDRTHEQQMNQKLLEALDAAKSANEAKSNFLSNMSHDIRTPMNAIVGFSVLLEKDADNSEKVREYTRKIMASSHHLLSLINDVLDMSKIESGKTSLNVVRFSLPELLDELNTILLPQAKAKKQSFTIKVKGVPPEQMMGDKLRLNQILINLLSNAIKYTQEGGNIEFTVKEIPNNKDQFVKLQFTVKDNGIGMSKEFINDIFSPFSREINSTTNKIQGTGLGMAITKNLVDLMGGIIKVESEHGKGSVFTVEMSFALPESEESDAWFKQRITRLLVADDEEDICLGIKEMMRDTDVDVAYELSGAKAVEHAVRAHESGNGFNVILLDWKMPEMDGVETAKQIRAKIGKNVPILVLTSYDWTEIEDEAKKAGIDAFMPKPFFVSTFLQTIKPLFVKEEANSKTVEVIKTMENKNFLVVEDNELNAEILAEMLKIEGANYELATNGREAVEMFVSSAPDKYDLILMDVQMPIMNGYEATKAIRQSSHPRAKDIPIVAMTANTFSEDVRNAFDSGMNGHLSKPINMDAVRALVGKLLNNEEKGDQT